MTVGTNLEARNIRSGFDFLSARAGFEIGETLIPFSSADSFLRAFGVGTLNTLYVSAWAIVTSTVLGFVVGLMRLSRHPMLRLLGTAHVEAYRNIPLLVLLFAIYLVVTELLPRGTAPGISETGFISPRRVCSTRNLSGGGGPSSERSSRRAWRRLPSVGGAPRRRLPSTRRFWPWRSFLSSLRSPGLRRARSADGSIRERRASHFGAADSGHPNF